VSNIYSQDNTNYYGSFLKTGIPSYTKPFFDHYLKDKDYEVETATLITGNDTLIGYFGQVTLIKEQQTYYYSAIGTADTLLFLSFGFIMEEDTMGYLNSSLALSLSIYSTEKAYLSIKYNPKSKTVLYRWNNASVSIANKIEIVKGRIEAGMKCPEFNVQFLVGPKINIRDIKEKIIVINWWHTKCAPCIKEIPYLNKLVDFYGTKKDIIFLSICDSQEKELKDFLKKFDFKYKQCLSTPSVTTLFEDQGYPQHIIINKQGKIVFLSSGGGINIGEELKIQIEKSEN